MCPPSAFFRDPGERALEGGARTGRPGVRVGDRPGIEARGSRPGTWPPALEPVVFSSACSPFWNIVRNQGFSNFLSYKNDRGLLKKYRFP